MRDHSLRRIGEDGLPYELLTEPLPNFDDLDLRLAQTALLEGDHRRLQSAAAAAGLRACRLVRWVPFGEMRPAPASAFDDGQE